VRRTENGFQHWASISNASWGVFGPARPDIRFFVSCLDTPLDEFLSGEAELKQLVHDPAQWNECEGDATQALQVLAFERLFVGCFAFIFGGPQYCEFLS